MMTADKKNCVLCGLVVDPKQRVRYVKPRWITYTPEAGAWVTWNQICAACLYYRWKSMQKSYDWEICGADKYSHAEWKQRLYDACVRRFLRMGEGGVRADMFALRGRVRVDCRYSQDVQEESTDSEMSM